MTCQDDGSHLLKLGALGLGALAALAALGLPPGDDFVGDWLFWPSPVDMSTSMVAV